MGKLNYTTAKTNELLAKIEGFPESVTDGKTPVFVIGTVLTLDPGMSATASVTQDGVDERGNPKYKLNLGIPKGLDGGSSGGGGVADSVQWANVLNKPSWIGSTKPSYTASEVGALPSSTQIPCKTSELTNDSGFTTASSFKTVNGQNIVGSGNIAIGSGLGDAPSDGKTYGRKNGAWEEVSTTGGIDEGQLAKYLTNNHYLNTESPLTGYMKASAYTALADTDTLNVALGKLEAGIGSGGSGGGGGDDVYYLPSTVYDLKAGATEEDIRTAFGGDDGINGVQDAINAGKKIFIKKEGSFGTYIVPVNGFVFLKGIAFLLSFVHLFIPSDRHMSIFIIDWNASEKTVKIIYPDGYSLDYRIYSLTSSSSSDEISTAVGGEIGLKAIIQAVKDGNRLVIKGTPDSFNGATINQDVQCNMYKEMDNGDMLLNLFGKGYGIWDASGGILAIMYTKSSNTFSCQVITV